MTLNLALPVTPALTECASARGRAAAEHRTAIAVVDTAHAEWTRPGFLCSPVGSPGADHAGMAWPAARLNSQSTPVTSPTAAAATARSDGVRSRPRLTMSVVAPAGG